MKKITLTGIAGLYFLFVAFAGNQPVSSIRGKVVDAETKIALVGVSVLVKGPAVEEGTITGLDGEFRFDNLPVGRYELQFYYMGYEPRSISNILLIAGKESVVETEMTESLIELEEVTVKASQNKGEPLNPNSIVSARSFSVEETKRYAGGFNDPSRLAASYAGVTGDPTGNNDIVIRGNSPRGLLWRLEGVEIPNPNHFADEGATGGPISILNSTTLDNSDFLTGAFPAEYGNAYSGVFDIQLRKGNNEKREYTLQAGILGFEGAAEGPFVKGKNASFLFNYRYSTLAMLNAIGVDITGDAVPEFQDLTFKVHVPTEKAGTFSVFGLGGLSTIQEEYDSWKSTFGTDMAVTGINHLLILGEKTYINSGVSATLSNHDWTYHETDDADLFYLHTEENYLYRNYRGQVSLNHKFNSRHKLKAGVIYTSSSFDLFLDTYFTDQGYLQRVLNDEGQTWYGQSFANYRFRISNDLSLHAGLHYLYFGLNKNYSLEPRGGMEWKINRRHTLSAGFGVHSKLETLSNYFAKRENESGIEYMPNRDLELARARHYVLAWQMHPISDLMIKTELYYQDLYNVPVMSDSLSSFSALNFSGGVTNEPMENTGTGENYGVELTVEKFFSHSWYLLSTTSLYESKYRGSDGVERNSRFNGNYVFNLLGGKEFKLGKGEYPWTLNIGFRFIQAGGTRKTPINLEQSRREESTVRYIDRAYSERYDDFMRLDTKISFIKNRKSSTHTLELDIQNVTNRLNSMYDYYDPETDRIETVTQLGFIPAILYRVEF